MIDLQSTRESVSARQFANEYESPRFIFIADYSQIAHILTGSPVAPSKFGQATKATAPAAGT